MALRGPAGAVQDLVVDPAHRRGGVGGLLLKRLLAMFAERGMTQVALSTAQQNESAQRLFECARFQRTMIEMTRDDVGSSHGDG